MLQGMDSMDASCIIWVNVGMFTHLGQCQIWDFTFHTTRIVKLPIPYDLIVSVRFMDYSGDYLRYTSADIVSLEE
jgi:hypothetical protein